MEDEVHPTVLIRSHVLAQLGSAPSGHLLLTHKDAAWLGGPHAGFVFPPAFFFLLFSASHPGPLPECSLGILPRFSIHPPWVISTIAMALRLSTLWTPDMDLSPELQTFLCIFLADIFNLDVLYTPQMQHPSNGPQYLLYKSLSSRVPCFSKRHHHVLHPVSQVHTGHETWALLIFRLISSPATFTVCQPHEYTLYTLLPLLVMPFPHLSAWTIPAQF